MYRFNCEICEKEFTRKYIRKNTRFCSKQCMWKDDKYRKKMAEANKKLNDNPTKAMLEARFKKGHDINNGKHRSPSTEFKGGENNPNWKGGTSKKRGKDWNKQRKLALERDDETCQRCGNEAHHVHHITRYSEVEDNSLENLICLCRRCHIITERGYSKLIVDGQDIVITHVPERTLKEFIQFSDKEFNGKNAMAVKFLWDFFSGHYECNLDDIYSRLEALEGKPKEEEPQNIKSLDGKEIGRK